MNLPLFILIILITQIDNTPLPSQGLFTHQITLWYAQTNYKPYNPTPYQFSLTVSNPCPTSYLASLALCGYKLQNDQSIHFDTTLGIVGNGIDFTITVNPGSTMQIAYLSYFLIIVLDPHFDRMQTITNTYSCNLLNTFPHSNNSEQLTISTLYSYTNNVDFKVIPFLVSVISQSTNSSIDIQLSHVSLLINTTNIKLAVSTKFSAVTISSFKYSVLIYNQSKYKQANLPRFNTDILSYVDINNGSSFPLQSIPTNFNLPSLYGAVYADRCAFGIYSMALMTHLGHRNVIFNATTSSITQADTTPTSQSILSFFHVICMIECDNTTIFDVVNQQCIACPLSECQVCINTTLCKVCDSTYAVNSSSGSCELCSSLSSGCLDCNNQTNCSSCINSSYFLNTTTHQCSTCVSSLTGCLTCLNSSVCSTCADTSFFLNMSSNCILCNTTFSNCINCTNTSCTTCPDNTFFLLPNGCFPCNLTLTGCANCSNNSTCLACLNNSIYLNSTSNQCQTCNTKYPNCITCDSTSCLSCSNSNYYLNQTGCYLCSALIGNCTTCNISTQCNTCVVGFFPATSSCDSCTIIPSCLTCINASYCLQCLNTQYALNTSNLCQTCDHFMPYCLTCTNNTHCLTCNNSNYSVVANHTCAACGVMMVNCLQCSSSTVCTQCANGSYINMAQTCTSCGQTLLNCAVCPTINSCTACITNNFYISANSSCLSCQTTLFKCLQCSNSTTCTKCLTNSYYVNSTLNTCFPCPITFPNCIECDIINNVCTLCPSSMFINSLGVCSCRSGKIVTGLCTPIIGCTQTKLNNNSQVLCISCSSEFNLINNVCKCKVGYLISQHCLDMQGCITAGYVNGIMKCISCNNTFKFTPNPQGGCTCQPKYVKMGSQCKQICGDGFLMQYQCDDGNTLDGDGCSHTCKIQPDYFCQNGTAISPSNCKYNGKVTLSVYSMQKLQQNNEGIFKFSLSPALTERNGARVSNITLNCPSKFSIINSTYSGGIVTLVVQYYQDLQDVGGELTLGIDPQLSNQTAVSINFTFVSHNIPLMVTNQIQTYILFTKLCKILSYLALAVFFLSLYTHKMIGVQLLTAMQVVYLSQATNTKPSILFNSISSFKMIMGYNSIYHQNAYNSFVGYFSKKIQINKQFLENALIPAALILIAVIICSIFIGRKKYFQPKKNSTQPITKSLSNIYNKSAQLSKHLYYKLAFPLTIGFLQSILLCIFLNNLHNPYTSFFNSTLNGFMVVVTFISFSVIFFTQLLGMEVRRSKSGIQGLDGCKSKRYIPFFLLTSLSFNLMLLICIHRPSSFVLALSQIIITTMLFWILVNRPYQNMFHNFCIVINTALMFVAVGLSLMRMIATLSQSMVVYLVGVLLVMMFLSVALSLFRIVLQVYLMFNKTASTHHSKKKIVNKMKESDDNYFKSIGQEINKFSAFRDSLIAKGPIFQGNQIPAHYFLQNQQPVTQQLSQMKQIKKKLKQQLTKFRKQQQNRMDCDLQ